MGVQRLYIHFFKGDRYEEFASSLRALGQETEVDVSEDYLHSEPRHFPTPTCVLESGGRGNKTYEYGKEAVLSLIQGLRRMGASQ